MIWIKRVLTVLIILNLISAFIHAKEAEYEYKMWKMNNPIQNERRITIEHDGSWL